MSWNSVIAQKRVKELLDGALTRGRLAHAFLFTGPDGSGTDAMAIALAKILNCRNSGSASVPCAVCPDCTAMAALQHPNLNLIFPLPIGRNEVAGDSPVAKLPADELEEVQRQIALKAGSPYYRIVVPKATTIKLNSIREMRRLASLSSFGHGKKIFIVLDAGEMRDEAANALLKTLEEPLPGTHIILCAESVDELLPTIVSRCQRVSFDALSDSDIQMALTEREGVDPAPAALIAAVARGNYRMALELKDVDLNEYRDDIVELLRVFLYKSREDIYAEIDRLGAAKDRIEVVRLLSLMQAWFHDSLALRNGMATKMEDEVLRKFTEAHPHIQYGPIAIRLDEAISEIGKNVYIPLLLTVLAIDIRNLVLTPVPYPS